MFKKIEIWILYLVIFLGFVFAVGFGVLVRQELVSDNKLGWISKFALNLAEIPANLRKVALGDLQIQDRFESISGFQGTPNDQESFLLLSRFDGDLNEGIVEIIDLTSFEILHTWNPDIDSINDLVEKNDEFKNLDRDYNNSRKLLVHPKLTTDGGLWFGWESPLSKIDTCSKLIFQIDHDNFHHSIETDLNGNIWAPSYPYPQSLDNKKVGSDPKDFRDNAIVQLSADGKVLFEKSVSQILIDNGLEYLLFGHGSKFDSDPVHLNDIQPANFDSDYWKKGDLFLSLRNQSMILLYRPSTNKIIWKGTGKFFMQHDVDILDDHRISIFNNNSKNLFGGFSIDGNNEVIIYDFKTNNYSTYLSDSLLDHNVKTPNQGRGTILTNGDLFIEETYYGRALYFNADGSLRWTHVNRAGDGKVYAVGWSRILYTKEDIQTVKNFLTNKGTCNE